MFRHGGLSACGDTVQSADGNTIRRVCVDKLEDEDV